MASRIESNIQTTTLSTLLPQPASRQGNVSNKVRHAWNACVTFARV